MSSTSPFISKKLLGVIIILNLSFCINLLLDLITSFQAASGKSAKATAAAASGSDSASGDATTVLATQLQGIFKQGSTSGNKK